MSRAAKPAAYGPSPGPWTATVPGTDQNPFLVLDKRGRCVAITYLAGGPPATEARPNARLIAAAPAMYDLLRSMLDDIAYTAPEALPDKVHRWHERARAIVATVNGEGAL